MTVTINPQPSAPVLTFNGTAYVSSQSGAGTHAWFVNGNQVTGASGSQLNIFSGAGNPVVEEGDEVYAIYTDENGCSSQASATILGVEDAAAMSNNVSLYPNPSNGQFEIRFGDVSGKVTIEVTNLVGQVVFNNVISASNGHVENMDLSNLKGGVYQINFSGDAGKTVENIVIK